MKELAYLVNSYANHDSELKELKKVHSEENEQIKAYLADADMDSISTDDFVITRSISNRETMDEERLLAVLMKDWTAKHGSMLCPYIVLVPAIDYTALESAVYNGELDTNLLADMDACRSVKEVVTLRVKKNKGAK